MAKVSKVFGFCSPYMDRFYKKQMGELIIEGNGYYNPANHYKNRHDDNMDMLFSFDIERILWNLQDITKLYRAEHMLDDNLMTHIAESTQAHMEWIFREELAAHYGEPIEHEEDATTDLDQHIDFPTDSELQDALRTIRMHSKQSSFTTKKVA